MGSGRQESPDPPELPLKQPMTRARPINDMNPTHLHLMLNHIPVLGTAFGLGLLAFGLWRRSDELKKASLGVLVIIALLAVPAYLTGEPAEDLVKPLPGVSRMIMGHHEEAAEIAFTGLVVLGVASLAGLILFRRGKSLPAWLSGIILAGSLVVVGLMSWTANLGGQIRHTEIRPNSDQPASTPEQKRE